MSHTADRKAAALYSTTGPPHPGRTERSAAARRKEKREKRVSGQIHGAWVTKKQQSGVTRLEKRFLAVSDIGIGRTSTTVRRLALSSSNSPVRCFSRRKISSSLFSHRAACFQPPFQTLRGAPLSSSRPAAPCFPATLDPQRKRPASGGRQGLIQCVTLAKTIACSSAAGLEWPRLIRPESSPSWKGPSSSNSSARMRRHPVHALAEAAARSIRPLRHRGWR